MKKDEWLRVRLTPSWQGKICKYSGIKKGYECYCDGCNYFLKCLPQFDWRIKGLRKKIIMLITKTEG